MAQVQPEGNPRTTFSDSSDRRERRLFANDAEMRHKFFVERSYNSLAQLFDAPPDLLAEAAEVKAGLLEKVYEQGDQPVEEVELNAQQILSILRPSSD
jgi:hypothetical protein